MNKIEFFKKSLKSKAYFRMEWVISAFSITRDKVQLNYPYEIIQTTTGFFFCDPENNLQLTKIEDAAIGSPLFIFKDRFLFTIDDCENLTKEVEESIGNVLTNLILLVYPFKKKIPFVHGRFSIPVVEDIIAEKLTTVDNNETSRDNDLIYVDEYKKYVNAVSYMEGLAQLCVHAASERVLLPPPGIEQFRNKLLLANKDNLHNSAVVAGIETELEKFDADYLKGDPSGDTICNNAKMRKIVRKKLHLMIGGGDSLVESSTMRPIFTSLDEGWKIEDFPQLNDSLRAGSYNRGTQTQLGGVITKMLLRASANIKMLDKDCGTKLGLAKYIDKSNYYKLTGIYIIDNGVNILVKDKDMAKLYIGKTVIKRSPMYCKAPQGDLCKVCLGEKLANSPQGLSLASSDFGSSFLRLFLKKMHSGGTSVAKLDLNSSID